MIRYALSQSYQHIENGSLQPLLVTILRHQLHTILHIRRLCVDHLLRFTYMNRWPLPRAEPPS